MGIDELGIGKRGKKRLLVGRIPLIMLALFCGFMASLVDTIRIHQCLFFSWRCVWFTVLSACLFFAFVLLGERLVAWFMAEPQNVGTVGLKLRARFSLAWNWKQCLLVTSVIQLCWMPYLWLSYPGVLWYDTGQQLMQWFHLPTTFTDGSHWSDHHPVFDTFFIGAFAELGKMFGSVDRGLFLCSIVLSVLSAASFATIILYCRRLGTGWRLDIAQMLFFALFPVLPIFSMSLVKDSIFMPFFIWFAIFCIEIVHSHGLCIRRPATLVLFFILFLLVCLTKKTGLYIAVICCFAVLFVVIRKYRLRIAAVLLMGMVIFELFIPKVVFPANNIQEGGKQEMLAIPFQQSALEIKRHGKDMDKHDVDVIYTLLGKDVASRYQWWASDNVKGYTWDRSKDPMLGEYARVWVRGLIKYPQTYVEAYLALQESWLGIPSYGEGENNNLAELTLPVFLTGSDHMLVANADQMGFKMHGRQAYVQYVEKQINKFEQLPVFNLLFSRAIWTTWMFLFVVYEWCRNHRMRDIAWLMPYIATFLFLWISPATVTVEGVRYTMPMIVLAPLMWGLLAMPRTHSEENDSTFAMPQKPADRHV